MRRTFEIVILLFWALPGIGAHAADQPAPAPARALGAERPHNLCLGGLDDRKLIVPEQQIRNPFRETTHLGCEVEGGRPTVMPDLPAPQSERTVLG